MQMVAGPAGPAVPGVGDIRNFCFGPLLDMIELERRMIPQNYALHEADRPKYF